jgi:protein-L-isoaspartate(D-aspartate) O-methyltransferase
MAAGRPELNPAPLASAALASQRVRERMAERIGQQGVRNVQVLYALATVPRHLFVDPALASRAYEDTALPIGHGQTISRPFIVARCAELMLDAIAQPKSATVLEIGTGCGYAAAVLTQLFGVVVSIERLRPLHELARANLRPLRLPNLRLVFGDGSLGVPGQPPFDGIVAAAAGHQLPSAWLEQLRAGCRLVAPLGAAEQRLVVASKDAAGRISQCTMESVRFVPLKPGTSR